MGVPRKKNQKMLAIRGEPLFQRVQILHLTTALRSSSKIGNFNLPETV